MNSFKIPIGIWVLIEILFIGGTGLDYLAYAIAMEEISRGCASAGNLFFFLNNWIIRNNPNFVPKFQNELI